MELVELVQRRQVIVYFDYTDIKTLQEGSPIHLDLPKFDISIELSPVENQESRLAHRDGDGICLVNTNQLIRLLLLGESINVYNAALVLRVEMLPKRTMQLPEGLIEFAQVAEE